MLQFRAMEMIQSGTHVNVNEAYEILNQIKSEADLILPLPEPAFANGNVIG
jgi:N-acyl homoserine lactone hydrolase